MSRRIAVCLSGQQRTVSTAGPAIRAFFGDWNPDYFIHTWDRNSWFSSDREKVQLPRIEQLDYDSVVDTLRPFNAVMQQIETPPTFVLDVAQSQQCSMMRANHLKRNHEMQHDFQYDIVVKCRFDIIWVPGLKFHVPERIDPWGLYTSFLDYHQDHVYPMAADRFFWGSSLAMDTVVGGLYRENIRLAISHPVPVETLPEHHLYKYVKDRGMQFHLHDQLEVIVREQMAGKHAVNDFTDIHRCHSDYYRH